MSAPECVKATHLGRYLDRSDRFEVQIRVSGTMLTADGELPLPLVTGEVNVTSYGKLTVGPELDAELINGTDTVEEYNAVVASIAKCINDTYPVLPAA